MYCINQENLRRVLEKEKKIMLKTHQEYSKNLFNNIPSCEDTWSFNHAS